MLYNSKGKVIKKYLQLLELEETTYNFDVEDNHNYYVTENNVLAHNKCFEDTEIRDIQTGNCKNYIIADNYDDAMRLAKEHGGVSGEPKKIVKNGYGGFDYTYMRKCRKGNELEIIIKEHITGHSKRNMTRHIKLTLDINGHPLHIFY